PLSLSATPVCALRAFGDVPQNGPPGRVRMREEKHGPRSSQSDRARMREGAKQYGKHLDSLRSYQEQIPNHQNMCRSSGNSYSNPKWFAPRTMLLGHGPLRVP